MTGFWVHYDFLNDEDKFGQQIRIFKNRLEAEAFAKNHKDAYIVEVPEEVEGV